MTAEELKNWLQIWTIYDNPKDIPGRFVVRRQWIGKGEIISDSVARSAGSLEEARKLLPPGLVWIGRSPQDEPQIVESWL